MPSRTRAFEVTAVRAVPRLLRLAVILALVATPACKGPDPGTKNKPKRIEAGLGADPIGDALFPDETPKDKPAPADPTVIAPNVIDAPVEPPGFELQHPTQVTPVEVRGYDPQDKKAIVGKATPTQRPKP